MFVMENVKGILSMITLRQDISEQEKKNAFDALNELLELKSVGRKRRAAPQYILKNNQFKDPEERKKVMYGSTLSEFLRLLGRHLPRLTR